MGINYGIVGAAAGGAFIGEVHRVGAAFDPRAHLAAGCFSRDAQKNKYSGEYYRVDPSRVYENYRDMALAESARPDGITLAVVATPNVSHYEISREFLLRGINVLCEKPLCFEVGEAEELARLAKEKKLLFAVAYAYMGYSVLKYARELILSGEIGEIFNVEGQYPQEWLIDKLSGTESKTSKFAGWRDIPEIAGCSNCTGDIGSHIEYLAHYLTGLSLRRVAAAVDTFGDRLDLNANILVEYNNGAHGTFWCSQVAAGHTNDLGLRIYGTKGSVQWRQEEPEKLTVCRKGEPPVSVFRGAGYVSGASAECSRIPSGHIEGYHVAFANLYRAIFDALERGETTGDFPTADDGAAGVRFIHAVVESGKRDAAWVNV